MCFRHVLLQFSKQPCARSEFCRTCKSSSKKDGDKLPWIPGCTVCVFLFFACPPEEVSVLSYGIEKVFFVLTGAAKVSSAFLVSSLDSVSLFPCFFLVGQGSPNPPNHEEHPVGWNHVIAHVELSCSCRMVLKLHPWIPGLYIGSLFQQASGRGHQIPGV